MVSISRAWRELNIGEHILYRVDDFDGCAIYECEVKEVYKDHVIVGCPEVSESIWLDDDTCETDCELSLEKI